MAQLFGDCSWHVTDGLLDAASLQQRVQEASKPLYVISTAFSLAGWLTSQHSLALPPDSVLMVTGGMKGRKTTLDDAKLFAQAHAQLKPHRLVTEYGMTELSSQCWGTPEGSFRPAPWLRVQAIDPQSAKVLPAGQEGQLRFLDLANLDSTLGIETEDCGVVDDDGNVHLRGRIAGSELRGCSLRLEGKR